LRIRCQEIIELLGGADQPVIEINLGVTQDDGQFRSGQALFALPPLVDLHFIGQEFQVAVQQSGFLEIRYQSGSLIKAFPGASFHHADGLCLQVIAAQHKCCNIVGHFGEQYIAPLPGQSPFLFRGAEKNFDIYFTIRTIDTRRVVYEISINATAVQAIFDPRALREAQVAAFADNLAT